jgi:hypothetical protein
MKRILVDFDGVIHRYSKGWADGSIYDDPVEGVQEYLQKFIDQGYEVMIYSTRCHVRMHDGMMQRSQLEDVKAYLDKWHVPYSSIFAGDKPYADLLLLIFLNSSPSINFVNTFITFFSSRGFSIYSSNPALKNSILELCLTVKTTMGIEKSFSSFSSNTFFLV